MVEISVLIPVYNAKDFLYDSITSLLNQTFEDFELICVNDGSKDNSLEILNEFASNDSRVKVFDKENGGCGSARNFALEKAAGKYIYFFDPDDDIENNSLEIAYNNAEKNNSDMVIFKANTFDKNGMNNYDISFDYTAIKREEYDNVPFDSLKRYALIGGFAPWSKLYKKEFLDSYDDFKFDLGIAFDDVPFHVKSILRAKRVSYINKVLYHYRVDNANSVNSTASNGFDIFKILDIVENILKEENHFEDLKKVFYNFKVNHILIYILTTNSSEYFYMARDKFKEIDGSYLGENTYHRRRYDLVLSCETFEEFRPKYEVLVLENEIKTYKNMIIKLEKDNSKLKNKNHQFKKEIKSLKKERKEILNSKSWKITKPLRKINNLFD